jgi:flagellar basal body-associated protein FliL
MATEIPPTANPPTTNPIVQVDQHALSIQQLDEALAEIDPEFSKGLDSVRQVEAQSDISIDSIGTDDSFDTDEDPAEHARLWKRLLVKARIYVVKPKEYLLFFAAQIKRILATLKTVYGFYSSFSTVQKLGMILIAAFAVAAVWVVVANIKGRWLPSLYDLPLTSFGDHADFTYEFDPVKDTIPFFRAFPQDPEIFLFDKIKVNLRRAGGHRNPMGAFEIYAQVDSHDTAIELQTRQVEMHDTIARAFEEQSYNDLVSELGKSRLKGIVKKEIDRLLTQGWVNEIHFKTFVLKP